MRVRLQFWLTQGQWRYCATKGFLRICNPQKHNHDVQQADCFDLKAGEEDGSHLLFEMTPNACASLLSEQARQESRKKDAANGKVAAVVDDVLSKSNEAGKRDDFRDDRGRGNNRGSPRRDDSRDRSRRDSPRRDDSCDRSRRDNDRDSPRCSHREGHRDDFRDDRGRGNNRNSPRRDDSRDRDSPRRDRSRRGNDHDSPRQIKRYQSDSWGRDSDDRGSKGAPNRRESRTMYQERPPLPVAVKARTGYQGKHDFRVFRGDVSRGQHGRGRDSTSVSMDRFETASVCSNLSHGSSLYDHPPTQPLASQTDLLHYRLRMAEINAASKQSENILSTRSDW